MVGPSIRSPWRACVLFKHAGVVLKTMIIQDRNNQDWIYVGLKLGYFGVNDSEGQISQVISV